eukprot:CAMPEP_0172444764 /NCGR_PEP_ID=MMETSP1065-20121228/4777_1 /TAXON_ID=265537 /ORGANISM="Amphiprora paludosa, Strain CCMP125" /LENGTH=559 /DNA_ID=CAMNT_0013195449 /DNA_START=122 /DNA_END=1801 /DNA_ORIENTATION=+
MTISESQAIEELKTAFPFHSVAAIRATLLAKHQEYGRSAAAVSAASAILSDFQDMNEDREAVVERYSFLAPVGKLHIKTARKPGGGSTSIKKSASSGSTSIKKSASSESSSGKVKSKRSSSNKKSPKRGTQRTSTRSQKSSSSSLPPLKEVTISFRGGDIEVVASPRLVGDASISKKKKKRPKDTLGSPKVSSEKPKKKKDVTLPSSRSSDDKEKASAQKPRKKRDVSLSIQSGDDDANVLSPRIGATNRIKAKGPLGSPTLTSQKKKKSTSFRDHDKTIADETENVLSPRTGASNQKPLKKKKDPLVSPSVSGTKKKKKKTRRPSKGAAAVLEDVVDEKENITKKSVETLAQEIQQALEPQESEPSSWDQQQYQPARSSLSLSQTNSNDQSELLLYLLMETPYRLAAEIMLGLHLIVKTDSVCEIRFQSTSRTASQATHTQPETPPSTVTEADDSGNIELVISPPLVKRPNRFATSPLCQEEYFATWAAEAPPGAIQDLRSLMAIYMDDNVTSTSCNSGQQEQEENHDFDEWVTKTSPQTVDASIEFLQYFLESGGHI